MIELINMRCKCDTFQYPYDFYIDRRSPVGNPYPMELPEDRNWVCKQYAKWFCKELKNTYESNFSRYLDTMIATYREHGKLRLFCWCTPLRCHGETIRDYLES